MLANLRAWVQWVDALPSSAAIRESTTGYPALLTIHIVSVTAFAGLVLMMDFRLLGIGNRRIPFSELQKSLFGSQMVTMAVATISGLVLVYGEPTRFYDSIFFWIKMLMIALTGANAIAFHYTTYDTIAAWDRSPSTPALAKFAGGISIVLWVCVMACGRLVAYNWFVIR